MIRHLHLGNIRLVSEDGTRKALFYKCSACNSVTPHFEFEGRDEWEEFFKTVEEIRRNNLELNRDVLGKNLHQLLKESENPIMERALDYIIDLEHTLALLARKAKEAIAESEQLREELEKWEKKKHDLQKENRALKAQLNRVHFLKKRR